MRLLYIIPALFLGILFCSLCSSCDDDDDDKVYTPKPRGYCRIAFPEKNYKLYDSLCPFSFEIPVYSSIENDNNPGAEPCWLNVKYPAFNAQLHLSYKVVNNNLAKYIEDSRELAIRHQVKATGLEQEAVLRDSAKVFGLMYDIAGNTASSVQFYLTDSTKHFLRGSLYFNSAPNIDSMKIIIDFVRDDVIHLIKTCRWKEGAKK